MIRQLSIGMRSATASPSMFGRRGYYQRALYLVLVSLVLLFPTVSQAADDGLPTLAFLRFGQSPSFALTDMAVLDMLEIYGFINAEERAMMEAGNDLRGNNINILYRDAGFDFPTANLWWKMPWMKAPMSYSRCRRRWA